MTLGLKQDGPVVSGCYDREWHAHRDGNRQHPSCDGCQPTDKIAERVHPERLGGWQHSRCALDEWRSIQALHRRGGAEGHRWSNAAQPVPPALGCGSIIHGITFGFDSAEIRAGLRAVSSAELYQGLRNDKSAAIVIEGHTSSEGTEDYNLQLSERRAQAVVAESRAARSRQGPRVGCSASARVARSRRTPTRAADRSIAASKFAAGESTHMPPRHILALCYAASGAAALVYQVAWVRLFTLTLGHTIAASSTVLAAFMGGLAVGAWAAGRRPPAHSRALATYAALELLIAAAAIAIPSLLSTLDPLLVWAYADGTVPMRFALVRVAVSLMLLGIPAAAMGATYPIAVSWLAHSGDLEHEDRRRAATQGGVLYAVNTAGAAAGAIAAGFWLIPSLGIRGTTWVAVALNIAAAGGALWLVRASSPAPVRQPSARQRIRRHAQVPKTIDAPRPMLAAAAAAVSGLAALVYEVAWTRLLALVVGPTTYAFAIMAASFITGIAVGSTLGVRLARRSARVPLWLAAMLLATAISSILAAWFTASHLPLIVARETAAATAFEPLLLREAMAMMILLMPASISLGATFTLALAAASPATETVARDTARIYTANTSGAVAGALIAGFFLVPRFGLQDTFVFTSRMLVVAGCVIAAIAAIRPGKQRPTRLAGGVSSPAVSLRSSPSRRPNGIGISFRAARTSIRARYARRIWSGAFGRDISSITKRERPEP